MEHLEVVAAIIVKDGKILATQRGYGSLAGGWEFPGGKIEVGESAKEALVREIKEELDAHIKILKHFITIEYQYEDFALTMKCYLCHLLSSIKLLEHKDARWLSREALDTVGWLPADIKIIEALKESDLL